MNSKVIKISAPGKIIISGEHAVVYGYPALVAAINKRVFLTLKLKDILSRDLTFRPNGRQYQILGQGRKEKENFVFEINSEIPARCGLGSSAALAVAQAAALIWLKMEVTKRLTPRLPGIPTSEVNEIAFCLEKVTHGNPSGVDNTIATYGGVLLFQKGEKPKFLKIKKIPKFLLVNTGKSVETTKEMINLVKSKVKSQKSKVNLILKEIGKLPLQFIKALRKEDFSQLKWLIRRNERLLEDLEVVGQRAKKIIHLIEQLGGAAKICGAGGVKKGSGIALVYHQDLKIIERFCKKNKREFFRVKLGEEGVRLE